MTIKLDEQELFELTEVQKKVLKNDINSEIFDDDMKRRLEYILMHKYEQCYKRLREKWEPILIARGAQSLPTDKDAFAELVFVEPDYKDRATRDAEE